MSREFCQNCLKRLSGRFQDFMQESPAENRNFQDSSLYFVSRLYGAAVKARSRGFDKGAFSAGRLPCRVVSVGNLAVGGSGKTPMAVYLAKLLKRSGFRPVVISRGYKGAMEGRGGIVSSGTRILAGPELAGDEPYMMASVLCGIPVVVGADRFKAGKTAVDFFSPDAIILDDAFQHRRLYRDLDLVLVDAEKGFGNGHLLPRGILREPIEALERADAVILSGSERGRQQNEAEIAGVIPRDMPVFRSVRRACLCCVEKNGVKKNVDGPDCRYGASLDLLRGRRAFAFSGIAGNKDFKRMTRELGCSMAGFVEFPDHYFYTAADLQQVADLAGRSGADCLVTTRKDYVRVSGRVPGGLELLVMDVHVDFGPDRERFESYLMKFLYPAA